MGEKYTVDEARSIKIGLSVAAAILAIVGLYAHFAESFDRNSQSYQVFATFGRTDGLSVGDKVRLAGTDVGRITNARLDDNFHAVLTFDVSSDIKIPDDSSASIVSSGIMGSKYIEIEPGGSEEFIEPGGEFSYTQDAIVLEELVERIISIGKANRSPEEKKAMVEFEENMEN